MTRILLIDDESRLLKTLVRLLDAGGYSVKAGAGFSALAGHGARLGCCSFSTLGKSRGLS